MLYVQSEQTVELEAVLRCRGGLQISCEPNVLLWPLVPLLKRAGTFLAAQTAGMAAQAEHPPPSLLQPVAPALWQGVKGEGREDSYSSFTTTPLPPSQCWLKIAPAYVCTLLPVLPPIKQVLFEAAGCGRGARAEEEEVVVWVGEVHLELLCSILPPFHLQTPILKWNPFNLIWRLQSGGDDLGTQ